MNLEMQKPVWEKFEKRRTTQVLSISGHPSQKFQSARNDDENDPGIQIQRIVRHTRVFFG
jgi:hypothetical protein